MTSIKGVAAFSKRLNNLLDISKDVSDVLKDVGEDIETDARSNIDRGFDVKIQTRLTSASSVEIIASGEDAVALEYGSADGSIEEDPYLRPAAMSAGKALEKQLGEAVRRRIKNN